jgi:hypothetical protein
MTDIDAAPIDEFAEGEWDLGEILVERKQPKDSVTVYLSEAASYARVQLQKEYARTKDGEKLSKLEDAIAEVDAELEKYKYVIHLTAVPPRMREDISSKALSQVPMKLDLFGRDDPSNAKARIEYENILVWLAQIEKVVNPRGQLRTSFTLEQMQAFTDALPIKAQKAVDEAIAALSKAAEEYTVRSQNVDFS